MFGLISKTELLHEFRPKFSIKSNLTLSQIKKGLKDKMKLGQPMANENDDIVRPKLRSSKQEICGWVFETTNHCRLSRYSIEKLWVTEHKTKFLVLINVADDLDIYGGISAATEKVQHIERAKISGK